MFLNEHNIFVDTICYAFTCMEEKMIPQIGLLAESSLAYIALEWPTAVVDIHM